MMLEIQSGMGGHRHRHSSEELMKTVLLGLGTIEFMIGGIWLRYAKNVKYRLKAFYIG
jgi:hypothetical protein